MAKQQLTAKQRAFALEYIVCKNGTEAARRAEYAGDDVTLAAVAYENLRKPHIVAFINERFAEQGMRADEVIARLSEEAAGDMGDFISIKYGQPFFDLDKAKRLGKLHLIQSFENSKNGVKLKLYDAQAAQRTLAQHHGLLKDGNTYNFTVNIDLVYQAVQALEDAGIDATEFFQKAITRAEERKHVGNGRPAG